MKRVAFSILLVVLVGAAAAATAQNGWSQWGGPHRDFTAGGDRAAIGWSGGAPKVLWRRPLGPGYSAIVSDAGRLFTMTRRGGEEVIVALASDNGELLWEHAYKAPVESGNRLDTSWGSGPNSTPLVAGGRVYALGFTGIFSCLDAVSGRPVWRHDLAAELGIPVPLFGHSASPLPHGELIIVVAGAGGALAFRLDSGELVWQATGFTGSYASPAVWHGSELAQLVVPAAGELVGLDPRDGALLWRHPHANSQRTILSGAVFGDDRRLFASAYFLGSIGLEVAEDGGSVTEIWENPRLQLAQFNSIRVDGLVYGFHNSILTAIDVRSGEIAWRSRDFEHANLLRVGDRFLLLDRYGKLHLVSLGPQGATAHAEAQILEGRSWTAPTLVGGRLFARNLETIVAIDLEGPGGPVAPRRRPRVRPALTLPAEFLAVASRLMEAYRAADSEALTAVAARIEGWTGDGEIGHLASYYIGLAAYQRALLAGDGALGLLREAEKRLTEATVSDPTLVDAHILLSRVYPMYYRFDPARAAIVGPLGDDHLATALRYAPDDPRVMAIQGLDLVYSPPQYGGDPEAGLELLRRALERFEAVAQPDPYPNWGAASVWAWYGGALLRSTPPDREGAAAAFRTALELAPDLAAARRQLGSAG